MNVYDLLKNKKGFRFYYDKDLNFLFNEERQYHNDYSAMRSAKRRLRMYANLFNRDMRKILIKSGSVCNKCRSEEKLQIDHIKPIEKGGKNEISNIQILCWDCNRKKSNNH